MLVEHILRRQARAIRSGSTRAPQFRWRGGDGGDVDRILAYTQSPMEGFAAELGETF